MALGGDVHQFDRFEAFFLEAVFKHGLGVGEVEVFLASNASMARRMRSKTLCGLPDLWVQ